MDNQNPTTPSDENQAGTSWQNALSTEKDELLQLAVSIVCILYAKGVINYKLHHSGDETWGYSVKAVYEFLKENQVNCPMYPLL